MSEQAIAIYYFIDDFFKAIGRQTDAHCKISDAEILTTALLAARFFNGNLALARLYMQQHQGCRMIDKSDFVRRLHGLKRQLLSLFLALGQTPKQLNTCSRYLIDSFPVAVCTTSASPVSVTSTPAPLPTSLLSRPCTWTCPRAASSMPTLATPTTSWRTCWANSRGSSCVPAARGT